MTPRPALADVLAVTSSHDDPREALEVLIARDLLPEHWTDTARAPLWNSPFLNDTPTDSPPDLATLAAVASLGREAIGRVEKIADETWTGKRIVWRVMPAHKLPGGLLAYEPLPVRLHSVDVHARTITLAVEAP